MTGSTSAKPTQPGTRTFSTDTAGQPSSTQWHAQAERASHDSRSDAVHARIEPRMEDDPAFPPTSHRAYEKLHGIRPDFGEVQRPTRSRTWRIAMMLGVFIVGAGAGLIAAWWLQPPVPVSPIIATASSPVHDSSKMPAGDIRRSTVLRGISPGELPYDGAPPPNSSRAAAGRTSSADVSSGGEASARRNAASGVGVPALRSTEEGARPETPPVRSAATATTVTTMAKEPGRADGDSMAASAKASKQDGEGVTGAASKRRSSSKSATEREVERMRRQAEEELKKKTEHGQAPGSIRSRASLSGNSGSRRAAVRSSATQEASTRAMLAKCDRTANFIRRELCRWRICNGSWGRHGCPSYRQHTPSY